MGERWEGKKGKKISILIESNSTTRISTMLNMLFFVDSPNYNFHTQTIYFSIIAFFRLLYRRAESCELRVEEGSNNKELALAHVYLMKKFILNSTAESYFFILKHVVILRLCLYVIIAEWGKYVTWHKSALSVCSTHCREKFVQIWVTMWNRWMWLNNETRIYATHLA